jgi:type IV pilus assembly protein PilC
MTRIKIRRSYEREGFKAPVFEYRPDWPYISIGFGNEKDYFIENLSLLIASGMGIVAALSAISSSVKTKKMKKITTFIEESVSAGLPFWKAVTETKLFPDRAIALIRSGEEAGRLPEHLNLVTVQLHKEKVFKSRLRSTLMYPVIVLILALIIAVGSAWYVLPKLVAIFRSPETLPFTTKILLWLGTFFKSYGIIFVPSFIALIIFIAYILFVNKKSKFIGDAILFKIPGLKNLVQGLELSRFGYIFGTLLQAGFQVDEALDSIKDGTSYASYRKFYIHIKESINKGETFKVAFASYRHADRYIQQPIQQLIISAEKSGKLPETLIKIGIIFEEKTEAMSQDLATVLEPIVLVIVGLVVGFVVSGVIGSLYGISNQI